MNDTRPQWLRDWSRMYHAGIVSRAFPPPHWIAACEAADSGDLPPSSQQPQTVADVPFDTAPVRRDDDGAA